MERLRNGSPPEPRARQDRPRFAGPNEHGETFREVVWVGGDGRKWKTGVQEEAALAIEARILAALPAALERALPDHTKAIGFDHAASSCGAGCAAALVAAIEKVLESTPTEPVVTD